MKNTRFLNLFFVMAVLFCNTVLVYAEGEEECTHIDCELRLRNRSSQQKFDKFKLTDAKSSRASFTHPHIPVQEGTSQNWSGYAAFVNPSHPQSNVVNAVYGSWTVPTLSSATHNTWCSLWVGIDGYSSSTVEQLGTEHDWYNGQQLNYAWFEMYPNYSYEIVGFPANPGDVISASVVYQGNNVFVLTISNLTRRVSTTIPTSYTKSKIAKRSSAEWVLEAPYSGGILPLSHFNVVNFGNCTATINNIHGPINDHFWSDDQLVMVTASGAVKALPSALSSNGQNFSVAWRHE
jgi:Peptidase A4 family